MDLGLQGKVAAIAGGTRGLGYAIAKELVLEGASCSIGGRAPGSLRQAAQELGKLGSDTQLKAVPLDTARKESVQQFVDETVSAFGRLDMLVVNSGGPPPGAFADVHDEAWEEAFGQLVLGSIRLIRCALPALRASGSGSILCITSTSVRQPIDNLILSNTLRPAVAALAKSLSIELAAEDIRVNSLMPGRIETERVQSLDEANAKKRQLPAADLRRLMENSIPLGRYGKPEEFGRLGAFLLSPAASYITGVTVAVDGGMLRSL